MKLYHSRKEQAHIRRTLRCRSDGQTSKCIVTGISTAIVVFWGLICAAAATSSKQTSKSQCEPFHVVSPQVVSSSQSGQCAGRGVPSKKALLQQGIDHYFRFMPATTGDPRAE